MDVADFNGDGKLELAVGNRVLLGNGYGSFLPVLGFADGYVVAAGHVLAPDFLGDGKTDLAFIDGKNVGILRNARP